MRYRNLRNANAWYKLKQSKPVRAENLSNNFPKNMSNLYPIHVKGVFKRCIPIKLNIEINKNREGGGMWSGGKTVGRYFLLLINICVTQLPLIKWCSYEAIFKHKWNFSKFLTFVIISFSKSLWAKFTQTKYHLTLVARCLCYVSN